MAQTALETFWEQIAEILPFSLDSETAIKLYEKYQECKQMEREQMIDFAFNTYYYISGIMKVPFNQISENKKHAEDNYTRLQNETN